jgi:hypothetical protein
MDFFIKPIRHYILQRIVSKNINNVIKPVLFIGGNILYSYVMRRINEYNKIKPIHIVDITKEYIDKLKNQFIEGFKNSNDMNSNIEKEFYIKEDYSNLMRDANNELEKKWKLKTLIENTPRGNVIMYYDPYKQGFSYYSDVKTIPYNILNSVAMKYVTVYHCRDFFIDDEITPENKESPFIKIHVIETPKKNNTKNDVYKQINSRDAPFAKLKKHQKINKDDKPKRVYYRNKFICVGPVRNYSPIQTPKKINKLNGFNSNLLNNITSETKLQKQVMNYKDFKNKQSEM